MCPIIYSSTELGDIFFNADISHEEIIEATKWLTINKSVGGKCIPHQIVFGTDLLLPFFRTYSKDYFDMVSFQHNDRIRL